jgi:hypothetical protein
VAVASSDPVPRVEALAEAAPTLGQAAVVAPLIGLGLAAVEVAVFDWRPRDMIAGAVAGAAVLGALDYLRDTAHLVPHGTLQEAPLGMTVESRQVKFSSALWLLVLAPICVLIAWIADNSNVGALIVPGQQFGYAIAALVALIQVRRWERAHGRRVLFDPEADQARPLAGPSR